MGACRWQRADREDKPGTTFLPALALMLMLMLMSMLMALTLSSADLCPRIHSPRSRTTSRQTKFVIQPPIYDRFISNFRSKFLQFFLPYLHSLYPIKNKSRVQSTRRERIKIIIITVINMQQQGGDRILIFRGRRRKEEGQTENRFRIFLGRNDVIAVDDVDVNYRYYLYYRTHICINSHDSISMLIDLFESEKYPCQMRVSEFVHPYIYHSYSCMDI